MDKCIHSSRIILSSLREGSINYTLEDYIEDLSMERYSLFHREEQLQLLFVYFNVFVEKQAKNDTVNLEEKIAWTKRIATLIV